MSVPNKFDTINAHTQNTNCLKLRNFVNYIRYKTDTMFVRITNFYSNTSSQPDTSDVRTSFLAFSLKHGYDTLKSRILEKVLYNLTPVTRTQRLVKM